MSLILLNETGIMAILYKPKYTKLSVAAYIKSVDANLNVTEFKRVALG